MPLKEEFNEFSADRDQTRIDGIMARLSKVPDGEAIVTFIRHNNVRIELSDNPIHLAASGLIIKNIKDGVWEYDKPAIFLKRSLNDDNLLQAIVHEVGHLNQHLSKVGNPDRILSETETILFYRAAEADAQALATEVTWALKMAGDGKPWNETCKVGYKDICDAYQAKVTSDPASIGDGSAKRVAFDTWFGNRARVAGYNESSVNDMIPWLNRVRGVFKNSNMQEKPLDAGWVSRLDSVSPKPYLNTAGARSLLTDALYRGDTATRKADFANDNSKPAKAEPAPNPPMQSAPF
ncbi:MAG: hypothetical protein PSY14_14440 [bacterium]|nr:hypothetical protein [bacterium]